MAHWLQRIGRQLRHRWLERDTRHAFPAAARERISQAIAASERQHTGQICIYIESALPWSYIRRDAPVRERALMTFSKQRVWDTEHNNGVLVYLLLTEHAIEIVADRAAARHIETAQWQSIIDGVRSELGANRFEQAVHQAIAQITPLLVQKFPRPPADGNSDNDNELPDIPIVRS